MLREAGFSRVEASASSECWGTQEKTRQWGETVASYFEDPAFADQVIALGWTDRETLEKMIAAWKAWGEQPNAFHAWLFCEAVGWKQ